MDLYNEEFIQLFRSFQHHGVRYIIVGGFATNYHGYHRTTGDIDIWIEDSLQNRSYLISTFEDLGFGKLTSLESAIFLPGYCEIILDSGMYIELMDRIMFFGPDDFRTCYESSEVQHIEDVTIRYLSFAHHLKSKQQSSRLKDQLDAQELMKLRK